MKDPREFAITVRLAADAELESVGATDHANTVDGAALVLLGDEIIAVTNEYGTAMVVRDGLTVLTDEVPSDVIEDLVEIAVKLWTHEATGR